jgi:hypothetical protein
MSGGHFDYCQYRFNDAADRLKKYIDRCETREEDEFGWYPEHPSEVIEKFKETEKMLRISSIYLQRVDWLICGDDGDETFIKRLEEDLQNLEKEYNAQY